MFKKTAALLVSLFFAFSVGGCATGHKQTNLEMQGLKNQLSALETQVQAKDEEINSLKESLDKAQKGKTIVYRNFNRKGIVSKVKSRPNIRHIQICLKNAGYNPGSIDGKMGKQTRDAIKSFQKDNGLAVDGKIGKQTWVLLRKYLEQKVK